MARKKTEPPLPTLHWDGDVWAGEVMLPSWADLGRGAGKADLRETYYSGFGNTAVIYKGGFKFGSTEPVS